MMPTAQWLVHMTVTVILGHITFATMMQTLSVAIILPLAHIERKVTKIHDTVNFKLKILGQGFGLYQN